MFTSELVTAQHLARTAIIYIRQSTPHQVLSNQESLQLQYALQQRALDLGWPPQSIEIIDADLGISAVAAHHREGFKDLAAKVTLGQVGIIFSIEVQRLSRNCSDWYPLLDVCGYKGTLIADRDGIYDPASPNGRLLLGLKGALSEMEMHTMRSRLTAGLLNKARRGELALSLPLGLIRDEHGRVLKTPDLEVQRRIELVFSSFLDLRSACRVLRFFNEQELSLPGRDRFGDIIWKKPTTSAIISLLKNPAYAGAFVYGRSRCSRKMTAQLSYSITRLPIEEWKFIVKDKYPAYISWETFEKIRAMLKDNYAEYDRNKTRGVPRPGKALLHGLLFCCECGHKLTVQYKHGPEYLCTFLRQKYRAPVCQRISSDEVDRRIVATFFEALSPVELDLYARAVETQKQRDEQVERARRQQIERLRYEAALAQRHLLRTDPDNRLVAAELEARWEAALRELKQTEDALAQEEPRRMTPFTVTAELKATFSDIGKNLPQIWETELLSRQQKKALLRCLIEKVVLYRLSGHQAQARIVWRGGETSTLIIDLQVKRLAALPRAAEMERLVLELNAAGCSDEEIAERLTAQGHRSPMRTFVLPSTVRSIRLNHKVFLKRSQSHPRRISGYLTVPQIARVLEVPVYWIYHLIDKKRIDIRKDAVTKLYLFPDEARTLELFKELQANQAHKISF